MNPRRLRPWLPFITLAVAVVVVFAFRLLRLAPPPAPVLMAPPPYDNASLLRQQLQSLRVEASVVPCPGRSDAWYVVAENAEGRRGVLLAETRGGAGDGPNEVQAGSFHFSGDAGMVRSIREALGHTAGP